MKTKTQKIDTALILFVKNPVAGKVKTRLAAYVGNQEALKIYYKLIDRTRRISKEVNMYRAVYFSNELAKDDEWEEPVFHKFLQEGSDIGKRMNHALTEQLANYDKAILIGSDIAELETGFLNIAEDKLSHYDVVLGPAIDGGYYLIGLNKAYPEIFDNIEWSTAHVFDQTLRQCFRLGLHVFCLPALSDIDRIEDWEKYKSGFV